MNKAEVVLLLTLAGTYDYRKTGDADVEAWYLALDDIGLDAAKAAVVRHYRDSTDRLMPAHVRRGVRAIREEQRRHEPAEARALPSRFESDLGRDLRARRGAATVRELLAQITDHLADQANPALPAVEKLRAITAGPGWTPEDAR